MSFRVLEWACYNSCSCKLCKVLGKRKGKPGFRTASVFPPTISYIQSYCTIFLWCSCLIKLLGASQIFSLCMQSEETFHAIKKVPAWGPFKCIPCEILPVVPCPAERSLVMLTSLALQGEVKGGLHFQGSWYLVSWCQASVQVLLGSSRFAPNRLEFQPKQMWLQKIVSKASIFIAKLGLVKAVCFHSEPLECECRNSPAKAV